MKKMGQPHFVRGWERAFLISSMMYLSICRVAEPLKEGLREGLSTLQSHMSISCIRSCALSTVIVPALVKLQPCFHSLTLSSGYHSIKRKSKARHPP